MYRVDEAPGNPGATSHYLTIHSGNADLVTDLWRDLWMGCCVHALQRHPRSFCCIKNCRFICVLIDKPILGDNSGGRNTKDEFDAVSVLRINVRSEHVAEPTVDDNGWSAITVRHTSLSRLSFGNAILVPTKHWITKVGGDAITPPRPVFGFSPRPRPDRHFVLC